MPTNAYTYLAIIPSSCHTRQPMRLISASFALLLVSLFSATSLRCQESSPAPAPPVIRAHSSLVLVDVLTRDPKTGVPVRDFKKEDFRIYDNKEEVTIAAFDNGANFQVRPIIVWLAVICNEQNKIGGSAYYSGKEQMFAPALSQLDKTDMIGVVHWCDNGEAKVDLVPTMDREAPLRVLAETIKPIPFKAGGLQNNIAGEEAFRRMIRLVIQDSYHRNPQPLPIFVFLDGDHTGQPLVDLMQVTSDFLETSGIVFGIKDQDYPDMRPLRNGEQGEILHYMADQTAGSFLVASPEHYASALSWIFMQLHFRYEIGFAPRSLDGKRHKLKVELTPEAIEKHQGVHLAFRPEYIPVNEPPAWTH